MTDDLERAERIADRDRCDDVEAFQRAAVEAAQAPNAGGRAQPLPRPSSPLTGRRWPATGPSR